MFFSSILSYAALFHLSIAGYVLQDDYMKDFYSQFQFFTEKDPTNGHVKYIDEASARNTGLISSNNTGAVSWGVDTSNKTPEGRPSIRLESKKSYSSGLIVLDVEHMPTGCGTWPAFWMVGPSWPQNGEIDILEGVNEQAANSYALHTAQGCTISQNGGNGGNGFTGEVSTDNCDVKADDQLKNVGCAIKSKDTQSYGAGLNSNKGGVYATLWTDQAITMYFFPRGQVPQDVLGDSPKPESWGTPAATFSGGCDIPKFFKNNQIIFDTTFCGDWAGPDFSQGSCKSKAATCQEYVANNPEAFKEAYWTINALKVYQQNGNGSPAPGMPSGPSNSSSSSTKAASTTTVRSTTTVVPPQMPTSVPGLPSGPSNPSSGSSSAAWTTTVRSTTTVVPPQTPIVPSQPPSVPPQSPVVPPQTPSVPPQSPVVPPQTPSVPPQSPVVPPQTPIVPSQTRTQTTLSTSVRSPSGSRPATGGTTLTLPPNGNFTRPVTGPSIAPSVSPSAPVRLPSLSSSITVAPIASVSPVPSYTTSPAPSGVMPGFKWPRDAGAGLRRGLEVLE